MLERLRINNFVLIPTLDLDLYDGMSVITGETGSGKSIVLGALALILGAKADKEEIRAGEDKAEIEAVFRTGRKSLLSYLDDKEQWQESLYGQRCEHNAFRRTGDR